MAIKLTALEFNQLLEKMTSDVNSLLKKSEEAQEPASEDLVKSSDGDESTSEKAVEGSSTIGPAKTSKPEKSEKSEESEGSEGSEGSKDAPPAEAAPEAPAPVAPTDPATDTTGDSGALVAEYSKLPIEELKEHVIAAHQALMKLIGETQDPSLGDPTLGAAPVPPAPVAPVAPTLKKSESLIIGTLPPSGLEVRLQAMEKSLAEKTDTIQKMEEQFVSVTAGLKKLLEKGNIHVRKSIAGLSYVAKPGDLKTEGQEIAKSEAIAQLNAISCDPKLSYHDREKINSYVCGNSPQSAISHLLKK